MFHAARDAFGTKAATNGKDGSSSAKNTENLSRSKVRKAMLQRNRRCDEHAVIDLVDSDQTPI